MDALDFRASSWWPARVAIAACGWLAVCPDITAWSQTLTGAALVQEHCAACHTAAADTRAPSMAALRERSPESVLDALTTGAMRAQGASLQEADRRAIAEFLAGRRLGARGLAEATSAAGAVTPPTTEQAERCGTVPRFDAARQGQWRGWSADGANTRFQSASEAGLSPGDVPRLTLKWAFGFPKATSAFALPTVAGGRVFVGSQDGTVYALDAASGCTAWTVSASASVRTAIVIGPTDTGGETLAYFGDVSATAYAVEAGTGAVKWSRKLDDHPSARITGTPTLAGDTLFVPISSLEEVSARDPRYDCCTFRGSLVALDAKTGAVRWKSYTISAAPAPVGKSASGSTRWGPSGAAIWSAPTIDSTRGRVYVATGNMYTEPQQPTSDAVLAFDMDTGALAWSVQMTAQDVFVVGCNAPGAANCPEPSGLGPDFDFGGSPMLTKLSNGRDVIVIGQKSGVGWALDPERRGAVVWQYQVGKGSALGGMEFGSAADGLVAYFPLSDVLTDQPGTLHAVQVETGERLWVAPPAPLMCGQAGRGCSAALSAAISVIPGVVFAGSYDGGIRAYSAKDGSVIWAFDTNRDFTTVNGVPARGGTINGPGPTVAQGMVFINSGYSAFGGRAGNVLLAFGLDH